MKRTDWFPGTVKPVRVGWYEVWRHCGVGHDLDFWNGYEWCWQCGVNFYPYLTSEQEMQPWRGLTEKAK